MLWPPPTGERPIEASRYIIEEIKRRLPIWKREHYVEGMVGLDEGGHLSPRERLGGMRDEVRDRPGWCDQFGRRVEYLRISVTDKCNLRCVYCMPEEGLPWLKKDQLLSYEEIQAIVKVMAPMGLRRVRLTGGEPLVRKDLPRLVDLIASVPGIQDLAISTNGVLLEGAGRTPRRMPGPPG